MIKVEHVYKTFVVKNKEVKALQDINLNIDKQEIFGIIGHSGAGKSTLIRCFNLLETPTSGNVIVDGQDLTTLSKREVLNVRRKIGMIFQHFNLMPSRTVLGNVLFALSKEKLSKAEKIEKAKKLLDLVGLSDKINTYPSKLSGGQKQRVAIARALANDPKILLCDEATSALDPETTASILGLLKDLRDKLGLTIVLITHSMEVVKDICDKVAVIEGGRLKEIGDVVDIFSNPQADITKQFVARTSGVDKIYDLINQHASIVDVKADEVLIRLVYANNTADNPLIYDLANKYNVKTNIIFGDVGLVKNDVIGNLVIKCSGTKENITQAIEYIKAHQVQVEILKEGKGFVQPKIDVSKKDKESEVLQA